jgi:hypothetical protein
MKTKLLPFMIAILAINLLTFTVCAQELWISEEFSSARWEEELARLNPGYTTPTETTGTGSRFTDLNSTDLYFGKYQLMGAIECLPVLPCPLGPGYTHEYKSVAVAFRLQNNAEGRIEFPEIPNAGRIILHIRNGNGTNPHQVGLEKFQNGSWVNIHTFDLVPNNTLADAGVRDEVLFYDLNSSEPIKLRLINNVATPIRFMNLYRVDIEAKEATSVPAISIISFNVIGRRLIADRPTYISLYNMLGALVYETNIVNEIEIPASVGHGLFIVRSEYGSQKIMINTP